MLGPTLTDLIEDYLLLWVPDRPSKYWSVR